VGVVHKQGHPEMAWWYEEYLTSQHWKDLRERLSAKRGVVCEDCGSTHRVVLHHLTYARLGCERPSDMRFLCAKHHLLAHKFHDIPYLFLIYRDDYHGAVAPILAVSKREKKFTYPKWRKKKK